MLPRWLTSFIPAELTAADLRQWREATLTATSRLMAVLALPVVILSLINLSSVQAYWRMPISIGFAVLISFVTFVPVPNFRIRLLLFFGTLYIGMLTIWVSQFYVYLFIVLIITLAMRTLQHYLHRFHSLHAAHTIQISEARYQAIWDIATDAVVLLDTNGVVQEANPAFFRTYGYTPDQVQGKPMFQLLPTNQHTQTSYEQLFTSPHPQLRHEFELLHADGTLRTVEAHLDFLE